MERLVKATKPAMPIDIRRGSAPHSRRKSPATLGAPPLPLPELNLPGSSISVDEPDAFFDPQGEASAAAPKQALSRAQHSAEYLDLQVFSKASSSTLFGRDKPQTPFDTTQPWSGAIYTYQPEKHLFSVESQKHRERRPVALVSLVTTPIIIALTIAFFIIWFTPTVGLRCRSVRCDVEGQ